MCATSTASCFSRLPEFLHFPDVRAAADQMAASFRLARPGCGRLTAQRQRPVNGHNCAGAPLVPHLFVVQAQGRGGIDIKTDVQGLR
jgi:hypothetical protein